MLSELFVWRFLAMADQVIDALAQPSVRKQLHDALKAGV